MHNVSVAGSIWFGGIPSAEDIDLARRRGVARVIALCDPSWRDDELVRRCADLNLEFERVPVREGEPVPGGSVESVLQALDAADEKPVLMFCDTGGKSAMFFAIHRVLGGALGLEAALVEARRAGMKPGESEAFVRDQVALRTGEAPGTLATYTGGPAAAPGARKTAESQAPESQAAGTPAAEAPTSEAPRDAPAADASSVPIEGL